MQSNESLKQIKKGIVDLCVLSVLKKHDKLYTSDILIEIRKSGLLTSEGTIYPLLTRLKNKKLLTYEWVESNAGPPRKYYLLTHEGERYLDELTESWKTIAESVNYLIKKQ